MRGQEYSFIDNRIFRGHTTHGRRGGKFGRTLMHRRGCLDGQELDGIPRCWTFGHTLRGSFVRQLSIAKAVI